MWNLTSLIKHCNENKVLTGKGWVPSKPLNSTIKYKKFKTRIKEAYKVFKCELDTFKWP